MKMMNNGLLREKLQGEKGSTENGFMKSEAPRRVLRRENCSVERRYLWRKPL
jgi:hypothetical protein